MTDTVDNHRKNFIRLFLRVFPLREHSSVHTCAMMFALTAH
jgi:hypothetical protein